MIICVLSYFDRHYGPKLYFSYPSIPRNIKLDHIAFLMDFYEKGFFIHEFGEIKSANFIFTILNPNNPRGGEDLLMVSIVLLDEVYNLNEFKRVLDLFSEKFKLVKDIYEGFSKDIINESQETEKTSSIKSLIQSLSYSMPKETHSLKVREPKLLIYGTPQSGITTIINALKTSVREGDSSKDAKQKFSLGNISIITYSFSAQPIFDGILAIFLSQIDGLAFVMDSSDSTKFEAAYKELHYINKFPETRKLPFLVLLNKADKIVQKKEKIAKLLELEKLNSEKVKYFAVNALKDQEVYEAFQWLTSEILINVPKLKNYP